MNTRYISILLLLIVTLIMACSAPLAHSGDKMVVAVSIVPQASFVEAIAGDLVEVVTMIPPGSSAETYAPSPKQLQAFSDAYIYFTIGVPAEDANILPKSKDFNRNLKIVHLSNEVSRVYPDIEISPNERDPHIWLSPKRVKVIIDTIEEELSNLDPENKTIYTENAKKYKAQLDQADESIREALKDLSNKTFIAYHPAFGYFADDYDLEMISLEKEGKEATPQDFRDTIDRAKKENIKVIFYQAEVDSRQSKAFAKEINGRTEKIAPLAPDYIDNLERMANTFADVLK